MINEKFTKYTFAGQTGYIIAPWLPGATHNRVAVRHSANVHPWADETIHFHEDSEEYYFLRSGRLWLLVNNQTLTLEPNEFLRLAAVGLAPGMRAFTVLPVIAFLIV